MNDDGVTLESDELTVSLDRDLPLVSGYAHQQSGRTFGGSDPGGCLRINGADRTWGELDIAAFATGNERRYTVTAGSPALSFDVVFSLRGNTLQMRLDNIDDAHRTSKDFDPALVGVRYHPGGTVLDEEKTNFDDRIRGGMSHTRDVESGAIFRRFEGMMRTVPVEGTIHLDNMRITNCDPRSDPEGIGILEELVCGLMPIVDWLRERGISVSTEGYNGLPADPAPVVSAFRHHDPRDRARQIYHRKIMGGGRGNHYGGSTTEDYGICKSFHQDITYHPISVGSLGREVFYAYFPWLEPRTRLTLSFEEDWREIVERIYLGSLLNLFYLQHEMLAWDEADGGVRMRFAGGVRAEVCVGGRDRLSATWDEVVAADGRDRFVPLGDGVYCYSRHGCRRAWLLPPALRGRPLELFTLSAAGRGAAPEHGLAGDLLTLTLAPRVPVKIVAAEGA